MLRKLHVHVRHQFVGYLALFVALGGTAAGAVAITSNNQVGRNVISGHAPPHGRHPNVIGGSINRSDLASNSVSGRKVIDRSLGGADLARGSLNGSHVRDNSLTGADINESAL